MDGQSQIWSWRSRKSYVHFLFHHINVQYTLYKSALILKNPEMGTQRWSIDSVGGPTGGDGELNRGSEWEGVSCQSREFVAKRTKRLWRTKESFIVDTLAILANSDISLGLRFFTNHCNTWLGHGPSGENRIRIAMFCVLARTSRTGRRLEALLAWCQRGSQQKRRYGDMGFCWGGVKGKLFPLKNLSAIRQSDPQNMSLKKLQTIKNPFRTHEMKALPAGSGWCFGRSTLA